MAVQLLLRGGVRRRACGADSADPRQQRAHTHAARHRRGGQRVLRTFRAEPVPSGIVRVAVRDLRPAARPRRCRVSSSRSIPLTACRGPVSAWRSQRAGRDTRGELDGRVGPGLDGVHARSAVRAGGTGVAAPGFADAGRWCIVPCACFSPSPVGQQVAGRFTRISAAAAFDRGDPRTGRAAAGSSRRARVGDGLRRGRVGDPLRARAVDDRCGTEVRVAGDLWARGVLQCDQADAQRPAGRAPGSVRVTVGHHGDATTRWNARELSSGWDVRGLVHDPQPAGLYQLVPEKSKGWIWRCHIDVSTPNPGHDRTAAASTSRTIPNRSFTSPGSTCSAGMRGIRQQGAPGGSIPLAPKNMAAVAGGRVLCV